MSIRSASGYSIMTPSSPFFSYGVDDHSAIVAIVSISSCLAMIAVVTAKGLISMRRKTPDRHLFDVILLVAALALVCQTLLTVYASHLGLGTRGASVEATDRIRLIEYISSLVAIIVTACSRCSLNLVISAINDMGLMFYASRALLFLMLLELITTFFATAFPCPLPKPWISTGPENCPNGAKIYAYTTILGMVTDTLLCALAMGMVWILQNRWTKALVMCLFGSRILCPITMIPTLTGMNYINSIDYAWLATTPTIWRQVSFNLSVITACIPSLKAVLDTFSGNTFAISHATEAQHELGTMTAGRHAGLRYISQRKSKSTRNNRSSLSGRPVNLKLKLSQNIESEAACYFYNDHEQKEYNMSKDGSSESVQNLTDGVILVREDVEICYGAELQPSIQSLSLDGVSTEGIWDGGHHPPSWRAN